MSDLTQETYRFGRFRLSPSRHALYRDEEEVRLAPKSFEVLLYLVRNPGRLVTKEELLKAVWADSFIEEANLAQQVFRLRKAFESEPGFTNLIRTIPGRGYQFTVDVHHGTLPVAHPDIPDPLKRNNPHTVEQWRERTRYVVEELAVPGKPVRTSTPSWFTGKRAGAAASIMAVLAGASYGSYRVWKHMHPAAPPPLVVLSDFENATGDAHLDRVLGGALETDLRQSPYLSFLSSVTIQQTLTQMEQPKAAPFSSEVAREVCQRNNAQVLLNGVVARFGQHYLLTLNAVDCQSGEDLAQTKSEADTTDDIPHAIDVIAAAMRKRLGESRSSIRKYNTPLIAENTNSLEALERFSEATQLALQGKYSESIPLFQRAIELDPKFAVAYADMATTYGNLGDHADEKANLSKAYNLRDSVDEQDRLDIIARYDEAVTGNLNDSIVNYRLWTSVYPRNAVPWANLASDYLELGQAQLAIAPARQGLALNTGNAPAYVILARALLRAGQLDEAKAVCEQAISKHVAGGDLHSTLMEIDVVRHDQAGIQEQIDWAANSPNTSRIKLNQVLLAFVRGQPKLGRQLTAEMGDYYKQQGMPAVGAFYVLAMTRMLAEEGYPVDAKKILDTTPLIPGMTDPIVTLAEVGEPDRAAAVLKQEMSQHSQATLWTGYKGPQIKAAILLAEHKPQEAIAALSDAVALSYRGYDTLTLRGEAYLAAQQPSLAEQEFRKILDHPGVDPFSYEYPLAQLGLARALAAEKNTSASIAAYQTLFAMWKDADADLPVLQQARREYASLSAPNSTIASLNLSQKAATSQAR